MLKFITHSMMLLLSSLLLSCGGGGSSSHGTDYSVSFEVTGDASSDIGLGSSRTVMATVLKYDGDTPAPGIKVRFSIRQNQSGASLESVHNETQSNGTASAVYRAGNTPGVDIIEVKAGGARGSISFNVAGGGLVVTTLILEAVPDEVDIGGYSTIRVGGRTFDDLPAVGAQVDFSFQVNNSNGAFIHENQRRQQLSKFLDNEGWATLTYRAGNSSGMDIIQVNLPQAYGVSDTISILVGQGKALGSITLEAFKSVRPEEWVVRAIVRDRDGNLAPDVLVNFNVDNGIISLPPGTPTSPSTTLAIRTNVNGIAEAVLTDAYWATIHARVEEVELSAVVSIYDYVESGEIIIDAPDEVAGPEVEIRATVLGGDGYPLIDIPVTFEADSGVMNPRIALTDIYGEAFSTLNVGQSGTVWVQASVGNITHTMPIFFNVDQYPLTITTTTPPNGTVGAFYSYQLVATGGVMPYTWAVRSGILPGGLVLDSDTGLIYGYPTVADDFAFMLEVTDPDGKRGFAALTITIN